MVCNSPGQYQKITVTLQSTCFEKKNYKIHEKIPAIDSYFTKTGDLHLKH